MWAIASTVLCCCSWGHHHLGKSISQVKSSLSNENWKHTPHEVAVTEHNLGMLSGWLCMEPVLADCGGPAMVYTVGMDREWQYLRQSCSSLVEGAKVCGKLIWCGCKRPVLALQVLRSYPSVHTPFFCSVNCQHEYLTNLPTGGCIYLYDSIYVRVSCNTYPRISQQNQYKMPKFQ